MSLVLITGSGISKAPEVTRTRHLESMKEVLPQMGKVILDQDASQVSLLQLQADGKGELSR